MDLTELKQIYENYVQKAKQVERKAGPLDGFLGLGNDPRNHPCHMDFYEAAGQWVSAFASRKPDQEQVYQVALWILEEAARYAGTIVYGFLFAAHGFCRELIPMLSGQQCAQLRDLYDEKYPPRDRMPVQKEVYKLLKKGAAKGK